MACTVAAPWDAYVVSVVVTDGQLVEPGTPIATLEQVTGASDPLEAVVFVPAAAAPSHAAASSACTPLERPHR